MKRLVQEQKKMKRMVEVEEVVPGDEKIVESEDGFMSLMGQRITLFCLNYIYTGKLVGVNSASVLLEDAAIVFETGEFTNKKWADAQPLPNEWYVATVSIESYGVLK